MDTNIKTTATIQSPITSLPKSITCIMIITDGTRVSVACGILAMASGKSGACGMILAAGNWLITGTTEKELEMRKKQKIKKPKQRNMVVVGLIERAGAGAGPHSKRGYSRKVKHKKSWSPDG